MLIENQIRKYICNRIYILNIFFKERSWNVFERVIVLDACYTNKRSTTMCLVKQNKQTKKNENKSKKERKKQDG